MNELNVLDWVEYQSQTVQIVDHYGNGIYAIEINGEWKAVNEKELKIVIV